MGAYYNEKTGKIELTKDTSPVSTTSDKATTRNIERLRSAGFEVPEEKSKFNLMNLLDLLRRGEYAGATTAKQLLKYGRLPTGKSLLSALKGENKYDYTSLLGDMGMKEGWQKKALGFGLGVVADPLTYIPLSKMIKPVAKLAKKVPIVGSTIDDMARLGKQALGIKDMGSAGLEQIDTALKGVSGRVAFETGKTGAEYAPLLKSLGQLDEGTRVLVRQAVENPEITAKLSKPAQETATLLGEMMKETGTKKLQKGLVKGLVGAEKGTQLDLFGMTNKEVMEYLPHFTTKEFMKVAREKTPQAGEAYNVIRGLVKKNIPKVEKSRTLFKTINDANKWAEKVYGVKMFEDDIAKIIPRYLYSHSKNNALYDMGKELVKISDETGEGLIKLATGGKAKGMVKLSGPALENYVAKPEVAKLVNRVQGILSSDETMNQFLRSFDKVMTTWKTGVTVLSPAAVKFNMTNLIGATFNNFIEDAESLLHPKRVVDLLTGKPMTMIAETGAKKTSKEFMEELMKRGAFMTHVGEETFKKEFSKIGAKGVIKKITEPAFNLAEGVEKLVRTQLAESVWRKTGSFDEAVKAVWKVHGNYAPEAMSTIEREGLKRVIPFWTWLKTNIPFQIENLYKQTGKYATVAKAQAALAPPEEVEGLPDWMKERFITGVSPTKEGKKKVTMVGSPLEDIFKLTSPKEALTATNPLLRWGMESMLNKSAFTGRPIWDEELPRGMQTVKVPDFWAKMPEPVKKLMSIKEVDYKNPYTGKMEKRVEGDARKVYAFNSLTGPIGRFSQASKTAERLVKEGEGISPLSATVESFGSPVGRYVVDPKEQAYWKDYEKSKEIQNMINYLIKRGIIKPLR